MQKKLLLLAVITLMLFSMPVMAEEIAHQMVGTSYYDIWRHSDGVSWTADGKPGDTITYSWTVTIPENILENYEITRIETIKEISQSNYNKLGGYNGLTWEGRQGYRDKYDSHKPEQINSITASLDNSEINLSANIKLEPIDQAVDLKNPANRSIYDPMGIDPAFAANTQGWRWYVPYGLIIYGNSKFAEKPDIYVKNIETSAVQTEPDKTYTAKVTYGLREYTKPLKAKLGLTHNGYSVSGIDGQMTEFQPGEEKTFEFTFTGQNGKDSVLEAKIWPIEPTSEDKDWSNNSKSITVPAKIDVDLKVNKINIPDMIVNDETVEFEAHVISNVDYNIETQVVWKVNGSVIKRDNITVRPGQGYYPWVKYQLPDNASSGDIWSVEIEVNPNRNKPSIEKTWTNNIGRDSFEIYKDKRESPGLSPVIILE